MSRMQAVSWREDPEQSLVGRPAERLTPTQLAEGLDKRAQARPFVFPSDPHREQSLLVRASTARLLWADRGKVAA